MKITLDIIVHVEAASCKVSFTIVRACQLLCVVSR